MFLHSNNDKTSQFSSRKAKGETVKRHTNSSRRSEEEEKGFTLLQKVYREPGMDRDSHSEDTLSTMVLENVKNKLIHAFRVTAETREESDCSVGSISIGRSRQANEELRRAKIDGAITWLRSELVSVVDIFTQHATGFTLIYPEKS